MWTRGSYGCRLCRVCICVRVGKMDVVDGRWWKEGRKVAGGCRLLTVGNLGND